MRTSELIHNGLYMVKGEYVRYHAIYGTFFQPNGKNRVAYVGNGEDVLCLDDDVWCIDGYRKEMVDPIPLTDEIYLLNGFVRHSKLTWIHPKSRFIFPIPNKYVCVTAFNGCVEIRFVHELQRVMHVCGLYDEVKNFKLE